MERPALQRLLADIDDGKIDVIIVYKIDRLLRSLLDFMKMIELFNEKEVSFVSVTRHFSTTDPTGRMFLGILITFAQYERARFRGFQFSFIFSQSPLETATGGRRQNAVVNTAEVLRFSVTMLTGRTKSY